MVRKTRFLSYNCTIISCWKKCKRYSKSHDEYILRIKDNETKKKFELIFTCNFMYERLTDLCKNKIMHVYLSSGKIEYDIYQYKNSYVIETSYPKEKIVLYNFEMDDFICNFARIVK